MKKILKFKDDAEYDRWLNTKKEKPFLELVKDGIIIMIGNEIYINTIKK
jgi:hypothetical protein